MKIKCADNSHEEVDKFTYLGCELRKDGDVRNEINIRIDKTSAAFKGLSIKWTKNCISIKIKLKLFNSVVISILKN